VKGIRFITADHPQCPKTNLMVATNAMVDSGKNIVVVVIAVLVAAMVVVVEGEKEASSIGKLQYSILKIINTDGLRLGSNDGVRLRRHKIGPH
jgi:hypothetical protein